ncbi:hypothetical protein F4810DRAFT_696169 [Camillea tinctor]|nr:hypothetical protein F4810DRAFT_696169 [Camillea tinctor]
MDAKLLTLPYQCSICGSKFGLPDALVQHMDLHGVERVYTKRQRICRRRSMPRAMQACRSCAASKTKCDNDRQCRRCRMKNISCIRPIDIETPDGSFRNQQSVSSKSNIEQLTVATPGRSDFSPSEPMDQSRDQEPMGDTSVHPQKDNIERNHQLPTPAPSNVSLGVIDVQRPANSPTWDIDLLQDHFYLDANSSSQDTDFLLSLPSIMSYDDLDQTAHTPTAISPVVKEEKSFLLKEAFSQATGRWIPVARNFQEDEEKNLSESQVANITTESPQRWNFQLLPDGFPYNARDRLLVMLVGTCKSENIRQAAVTFPSCEALGRLYRSFLSWHMLQEDTWIHVPTFSINNASTELLAAIISGGAVRSASSSVQKFGLALHEIIKEKLRETSRKSNIITRDLQFLQAYALQIQIGSWSGNKRKMEIAGGAVGNIVNILRACGHFRRFSVPMQAPLLDEPGLSLETIWRNWVERESVTRLVYHIQSHCSQAALMTSVSSPLSCTEISLRLPQSRRLWLASSATEWKQVVECEFKDQITHSSIIDCLMDLSQIGRLPSFYDIRLAKSAVLYSLSMMLQNYRHLHLITAESGEIADREGILMDDSHYRWLFKAFENIYQILKAETVNAKPPASMLLLVELLLLHLHASVDQMELLAGKEGYEEAQISYSTLRRRVGTPEARRSLWHAGQVLRWARLLPIEEVTDFHCMAVYHASLCFWACGVIMEKDSSNSEHMFPGDTNASIEETVLLDGEETLITQAWISYNNGRPVLSKNRRHEVDKESVIPIESTNILLQICIDIVRCKYPSRVLLPPTTECLCNLMHALAHSTRSQ